MSSLARQYGEFFERLSKDDKQEIYEQFFDENSLFEDPFQRVVGVEKIYQVFENMYTTLHNPKFIVEEIIEKENIAYIKWQFFYAMSPGAKQEHFTGISRVAFSEDAKVISHTDYWDAASNVYEKIPLLGVILRFIKRKIHA